MKNLITTSLFFVICQLAIGQGVGIGTQTPDSSALLDLSSTTKGMLMPRMTTAQRNAIVSPAPGLQIVNLDDYCVDIYDGVYWIKNCGYRITDTDTLPETGWIQRQDFGGTPRFAAVAFSIGDLGYVGTGTDLTGIQPDFWAYNPVTGTWTQKASIGLGRSNAVGFSIGTKGYVGTGINNTPLNDFWEYDPAANTWTQKAAFPGEARWLATGFSMNGLGFLGTGQLANGNILKDFWSYDPMTDSWSPEADYPVYLRSAVAFTVNNQGYVGTGIRSLTPDGSVIASNDFYYYAGSDWTQVADLGGEGRSAAVAFSVSGRGYVGTGRNIYDQTIGDFWEYTPATNAWTPIPTFSSAAREEAVGFSIGSTGYVGTGSIMYEPSQDFWSYEPYPIGNIYTATLPPAPVIAIDNGMWTKVDSTIYASHAGMVGIGTSDPEHKLQIKTNDNAYGISHTNDTVDMATYVSNTIGGYIGTISQHPFSLYAGDGIHQITLLPNGNVGINTGQPLYKLHLAGNSLFDGYVGVGTGASNRVDIRHGNPRLEIHPTNRPLYVTGDLGAESDGIEFRHGNGTQGIGFGYNTIYATGSQVNQVLGFASRGTGDIFFKTNLLERMRISGTGQVMIGTATPATGHLLSVDGKIAAEEILVDLSGDWPDYVFENEYPLPTLDELKTYIDRQGHLPGVPSATFVKENGIYLGEMNTVLLEKIEELTLYILAQEERIRNLESRIYPKN